MRELIKQRWQRWISRRIPAALAVRLDQKRIFILPTRLGAGFAGLLAMMLLVAINYQNSLAYALTFLLGSLFLLAILHTYANFTGLELKAVPSQAVFAGEQAGFNLVLHGGRRGHQAIACGWPPAALARQDVPSKQSVEQTLYLPAAQRGWLIPERMRVESRFPLGLLVVWSWLDLQQRVLVYPKPVAASLPETQGLADDQEHGLRAMGQGGEDFQGLRPHQPAEGIKRIAWKAYARGQGLMVKDFAALAGRDRLLDFNAIDGDLEYRLSVLCYWVLELSQQGESFALQLPGALIGPASGVEHRDLCLKALALFGVRP